MVGFEAGLIILSIWLLFEHVARPLWAKYRATKFPIDR
jgi:hypothetical protein